MQLISPNRLLKSQRIRRQLDFKAFWSVRPCFDGGMFLVKALGNDSGLGRARFAVVVGKKVGNAVYRNRIKRIFREIFRLNQQKLKQDFDYLVVAKPGIMDEFYDLQRLFLHVVR